MINMVEKVARAIYEKRNGKGCTPWAKRGIAHKVPYFSDARAAIEAMKEPTVAMHNAAAIAGVCGRAPWIDPHGTICHELAGPSAVYRSMVTAALSEESTS